MIQSEKDIQEGGFWTFIILISISYFTEGLSISIYLTQYYCRFCLITDLRFSLLIEGRDSFSKMFRSLK